MRRGWLCCLCLLVGCALPAPRVSEPRAVAPSGPAVVPVLLTAVDGAARITAVVDGRSLIFTPSATGVDCSDGRSAARLTSGDANSTVELDQRHYRGPLSVEPARGGLRALQSPRLEDYVAGVVAGELVLWSAQAAELEAQAIAARTFAMRRLGGGAAWLRDDTGDQRYIGVFRPASGAERIVAERLALALGATRGVILVDSVGRPLETSFHAACGGHTTTPAVFGRGVVAAGWNAGVRCEPCAGREPALRWTTTLSHEALCDYARRIGVGSKVRALRPLSVDESQRWLEVEVSGDAGTRRVSFEELRHHFGPNVLKSAHVVRTWPEAGAPIDGGLFFEGLGRGHGVGLCQEGTHGYAQRGWTGHAILEHYYPGARLATLRETPAARP